MKRGTVLKKIIVGLVALIAVIGLASPASASSANSVAAASSSNSVWLWNSPNKVDPHSPPWVETADLGECFRVYGDEEILSASNLNPNWKIRFYRGSYCNGEWGYSTVWEYGSGHTYWDNCVCFSGGGAQTLRRIA